MKVGLCNVKCGYTIIELMVVIVIVAVLAATIGTFVVNLLTLQEQEREEAYIREKLVDISGVYADYLSVGSIVSNAVGYNFDVAYRQETGGVSFETGRVIRVAMLRSLEKSFVSFNNMEGKDLHIDTFDTRGDRLNFSKEFCGVDIPLMTATDLKINDRPVLVRCWINPLSYSALWNLHVRADYWVKKDNGNLVPTNATTERIVRLWNHE